MYSFYFCVPPEHPCLKGHFSGNPIVPAVITIDEILHGISKYNSRTKITNIPSIKFIKPIKPGDVIRVNIIEKKPGLLHFNCSIDELLIVSGQLRTGQEDKA